MRLLLGVIRHGVTEWNVLGRMQGQRNIPLSEEGRRQALALGRRIPPGGWDAIYSSDLSRASETAAIIAESAGIARITFDTRLRERYFGPLEGTTLTERQIWGESAYDRPGVETAAEVNARVRAFLAELADKAQTERALIVTHGALIKLMLKELLGDRAPNGPIDNASMTLLECDGVLWRGLLYNENEKS